MIKFATQRLSIAVCVFLSAAITQGAEFIPLGDFPEGDFFSLANAISDDGTTIVGNGTISLNSNWLTDVFLWKESLGLVNLQNPSRDETLTMSARGVSADGSVAVGVFESWDPLTHSPVFPSSSEAFRWTAAEGIVGIGHLAGGQTSGSTDITSDGLAIVGASSSSNGISEAFVWTSGTGMVGLGDLSDGDFSSSASAVSANGSVIVGTGNSAEGSEAFRWTSATGMVGLGDLPGGFFSSRAKDVSADGTTIVGDSLSEISGAALEAFRWTEQDGMQPLGALDEGQFFSSARTVSSDGKIVFGVSYDNEGPKPFVWDLKHGMRNFQQVLINEFGLGSALANWQLGSASDISDDGLSIVGTGINPDGNTEAWLVRLDHPINIPEPSTIALATFSFALLFKQRRK